MKIEKNTKFQNLFQFTLFCIVGATGTLMSLTILYILTEFFFLKYWIALPIGYFLGLTNNFYWNRKFTFEKTDKKAFLQYAEYLLSMFLGALANFATTIILTEMFDIWYLLSAILAVGVSTVIDFLLSKVWVFGRYYIYVFSSDTPPKETVSVKLIISCLNEEKNLQIFIDELMNNLPSKILMTLILINNGSCDQTGAVIDEFVKKYPNVIVSIHRNEPILYGESIIEGLNYTINKEIDYVGWAWSDNQITGKSVIKVLSALPVENPRFVKALRSEKDYSLWRKIQSFFFNLIISILFHKRMQDINGCPKFFDASLLSSLNLQSRDWFLDAETFLKISQFIKEENIVYIPVQFNERIHGKSKTNWLTAFELLVQIIKFRFWGIFKWRKEIKRVNRENRPQQPETERKDTSLQMVESK